MSKRTLEATANAEIVECVRETASVVTGGNCTFADDDVQLLGTLALRAIEAGLIDGFDKQTTANLKRQHERLAKIGISYPEDPSP